MAFSTVNLKNTLLATAIATMAQTHLSAQPWYLSRAELASVVREESEVSRTLDGIETEKLGLDAVRCREHRLHGQTFTVGFRKDQIDLVDFSPSYSRRQPNWYQTLCGLFGDHPMRNNWIVDHELTSLFPSVTQSQVLPFMDTKPAKSRTVTFNRRTGQVVDVSPWRADSIPTGKVRWSASASQTYRCVLRRRDGRAFAIVEGSKYRSQELVPNAINLVRPFAHSPRDIRRVMVATPEVFFGYLIRTCAHELDNAAGAPRYEQQVAKYISEADRSSAKSTRLMTAVRYALRTKIIPISAIAESIQEADEKLVLGELTQRLRLSRLMRLRTLQLVGEIGGKEHIAYCQQFSMKPAFRTQVAAVVTRISTREKQADQKQQNKKAV